MEAALILNSWQNFGEGEADAEGRAGDPTAEEGSRLAASALFATGMGLDAIRRTCWGTRT